jgi:hypothetical protein
MHDESEQTIVRGSVHTDFGTITLLAQDSVGGLLAQKLNGEWVSVPPIANSVVVNVGDMLQMWSNDTLPVLVEYDHVCNSSCNEFFGRIQTSRPSSNNNHLVVFGGAHHSLYFLGRL